MQTCPTISAVDLALAPFRDAHAVIGFVPTLGALHDGHLSLVRLARAQSDAVVASIFLNPTQFSASEDLARYPRTFDTDAALLEREEVDVLFAPSVQEMYPPGFETRVTVEHTTALWEGASRPTHFAGVTTVVAKLVNIVRPARLYLGQKDAQQLAVIRRMVRDLNMPVEIVPAPTVREADGLAMSSRNAYLSAEERRAATVLYRALSAARDRCAEGVRDGVALSAIMRAVVEGEPRAQLEYAELVHPESMQPLERVERDSLLIIAAKIGATRLIDNMPCAAA